MQKTFKGFPDSSVLKPKFSIDDFVSFPKPDLFGEMGGKVVGVTRTFQEVMGDQFDPEGLRYRESEIDTISVPYTLEGDTLKIFLDEKRPRVYKFSGYSVTVESAKMQSFWPERKLTKI